MKTSHHVALMSAILLTGCLGDQNPCKDAELCDSSKRPGLVHGLRQDGTVDIDAAQAWPNRAPEPPPLTPSELAEACAVLGACSRQQPAEVTALCADPTFSFFWEERAVPTDGKNERWAFELRAILAAKGDCSLVDAVETKREEGVQCEEDGCWWSSIAEPIPTVTCSGNVARLETADSSFTRDCSRALAKCDPESPTGCTDRAPVACESPAKDRCDGAVRIGCDGTGKVSFHDCSRVAGGTCGPVSDGLGCVYPDAGQCTTGLGQCDGAKLTLCVMGAPVAVDCEAAGLAGCSDGACVAK